MKELVIVSGKGGAGKTTVAAAFAALAKGAVFADADVDAPDLYMVLKPTIKGRTKFYGMKAAIKEDSKCVNCGKCLEACRFGAIDKSFAIHRDRCEGCAVCTIVCPVGAIWMSDRVVGEAYVSETRFGPMSHALLDPGQEASGMLVSLVRENARRLARESGRDTIIIDGPPGTGCPVIAAIGGTKMAIVVVEPTLSSIHDGRRMVDVARHFHVQASVLINKSDVNADNVMSVRKYCATEGIEVIGELPYDDVATRAIVEGRPVTEYPETTLAKALSTAWKRVEEMLNDR
ncbi:MAG: ATP-binding protein [Methanobacteriota archaeon]